MNLQLVAPQMDLAVSYVEGHEDASQVATDGQSTVANGVPVFQHVLARLLNPSQMSQSDDDVSSDDVPQGSVDVPVDDTAEESSQTVPPAPETTQTVLARFASPVVQAQVTPPSVSAPPLTPPSDVKLASTPPETGRGQSLRAPAHVTTPFQPPIVNHSPSTTPTNGSMGQWVNGSMSHQPSTINHQPSIIAPSSVFQFPTISPERTSSVSQVDGSGQTVQKQNHPSFQKTDVVQSVELPRVSLQPGVEQEKTLTAARLLSVEKETQLPIPQRAATHQESRLPTDDHFIPALSPPEKEGGTNVESSFAESEHIAQRENAPPTLRHPPPIPPPAGSDQEKTKAGGVEVNTESEVEGVTEPTATFMDSVTTPSGAQPNGNENEPIKAVRANVSAPETAIPQSIEPVAPPFVPVEVRTAVQTERQDIPSMKQMEERLPRPAAGVTRAPSTVNAQVPVGRETKVQSVAPPEGNVPIGTEQRVTTEARAGTAQDVEPPVVLPTPTMGRKDVPSAERLSVEDVENQTQRLPMTSSVRPAHLPPPSANNEERGRVNHGATDIVSEVEGATAPHATFMNSVSTPGAAQSSDNGNEQMKAVGVNVSAPETATTHSVESFTLPSVPAVDQTAVQTKRQAANHRLFEDLSGRPPDRAGLGARTGSDVQQGFEIGSEDQVNARSAPQSVYGVQPRTEQSGTSSDGVVEAQRLSSSTASSPTVTAQRGAATTGEERVKGREVEVQDSPPAPTLSPAPSISVSKVRDENHGRENNIEPNTENESVSITAPSETFGDSASSSNVVQSNGDEQMDPRQRDVSAPKAEVVGDAASTVVPPVREGQDGQTTERLNVQNAGTKMEPPLIPLRSHVAPLDSQSMTSIENESAVEIVRADAGDVGRKVEADAMSVAVDPATSSESSIPFYSVPVQNHSAERSMGMSESRNPSTPTAIDQSVINQIVREAHVRFGRGETEMTLRLQPPHLGRLRMRLVWSGNELTAQMDAESQSVKQLIETNLPALYQSLSEQGIRVDHVAVSVGQNFAGSPFADTNPFANNARQQESMGQLVNGPMRTPQNSGVGTQDLGLRTHYSPLTEQGVVDYWA